MNSTVILSTTKRRSENSMTDAAVISGSLVDAKNVNTHKVMRLIIDVPAENALKVIAAFGWPTMVNPVSVAVARLDERKVMLSHRRTNPLTQRPGRINQSAYRPGRISPQESPAQIAGYLCTLGSFHTFLRERFTDQWIPNAVPGRSKEEVAKETLYDICTVTSRTQLTKDNTEWLALQLAFRLWETEAEVVPA
jgi:hypothetical protein